MKSVHIGLVAVTLVAVMAVLRIFVVASEKDSLLVQLNEQKKALNFLEDTLSPGLRKCHMTKADVERAAAKNDWPVAWDNPLVTTGPFKLTVSGDCVITLRLIAY